MTYDMHIWAALKLNNLYHSPLKVGRPVPVTADGGKSGIVDGGRWDGWYNIVSYRMGDILPRDILPRDTLPRDTLPRDTFNPVLVQQLDLKKK